MGVLFMAIKGIDTQIMITRTPDVARDASFTAQRPEVNQQILAESQKILVAQEQIRVKEIEETEMEEIRADEDGSRGNEYEGNGGKNPHEEEKDEFGRPGFYVPAGNNILDIRI
jgi:hypothetical protein